MANNTFPTGNGATEEFWREVNSELQNLVATLSADPGRHPFRDGAAWGTSVKNRVARTTDGRLSLCPLKLLAQRIVEGSMRLSTDSEIAEYLVGEEKKRLLINQKAQQASNPLLVFQHNPSVNGPNAAAAPQTEGTK